MSCGGRHSLALSQDGSALWAWGFGAHGQLGLGPELSSQDLPQQVPWHEALQAWASQGLQGQVIRCSPSCVEGLQQSGVDGAVDDANEVSETLMYKIVDVEGGRWHSLVQLEAYV